MPGHINIRQQVKDQKKLPGPENAPSSANSTMTEQKLPKADAPTMAEQKPAKTDKKKHHAKDHRNKKMKAKRKDRRKWYRLQNQKARNDPERPPRPRDPAAEAYLAQCRKDRKERERKAREQKAREQKAREQKAAERERLEKAKAEKASAGPAAVLTPFTDDRPVCIHCKFPFYPKDGRPSYGCSMNRYHKSVYEKVTIELAPREIGGDFEFEGRERWRCYRRPNETDPGCE